MKSWNSIVASSPNEYHFKKWEKYNMGTARRFVMKTWDWSEVYLARNESIIQRTLDEWRRAFTKFGGSVRRLFKQADDEIERSVNTRVATIDAKQLQLLLSDVVVFFDTTSHDMIQVNPQVRNDAIDRAAPGGTLVSAFVAHKLVLKRKADLVSVLRESFLSLLKNPGTASCAGILFEQMAHQYIFNGRALPYRLTSLAKPTQELSINLSHVDKVEYFDKFVSSDFIPFYYRPVSSNLPSIGSFAFEVNDQGRIIGMVAFQSTVSSSHPIDVKFFKQIWGLTSNLFEVVKLVFVIPKENHIGLQLIRSASDRQKWSPRIQQYVLEIDANKIWN